MPPSALFAIARRPAPTLVSECELTHIPRESIEFDAIQREHEDYCLALQAAGVALTRLDALPELPDSVFVEDAAVVLDEVLVLTRPGSPSREAEPAALAAAFGKAEAGLTCLSLVFARQASPLNHRNGR